MSEANRHYLEILFERHGGRITFQQFQGALERRFGYAQLSLVSADRLQQMGEPIEGHGGFHYFPMEEDVVIQEGYLLRGALSQRSA